MKFLLAAIAAMKSMLVPLAPTDKKFTDVEKQFSTQTKGGIANAKVQMVLYTGAIVAGIATISRLFG